MYKSYYKYPPASNRSQSGGFWRLIAVAGADLLAVGCWDTYPSRVITSCNSRSGSCPISSSDRWYSTPLAPTHPWPIFETEVGQGWVGSFLFLVVVMGVPVQKTDLPFGPRAPFIRDPPRSRHEPPRTPSAPSSAGGVQQRSRLRLPAFSTQEGPRRVHPRLEQRGGVAKRRTIPREEVSKSKHAIFVRSVM